MDKTVTVPVGVEDVTGLLIDLRKAGFAVTNVGVDANRTYVYMDSSEEKDPTPVVESWAGRPAPSIEDKEIWKSRSQELANSQKVVDEATEKSKVSMLARIFRKIWG